MGVTFGRINSQRLAYAGFRLGVAVEGFMHRAKVIEGVRVIRIEFERALVAHQRF